MSKNKLLTILIFAGLIAGVVVGFILHGPYADRLEEAAGEGERLLLVALQKESAGREAAEAMRDEASELLSSDDVGDADIRAAGVLLTRAETLERNVAKEVSELRETARNSIPRFKHGWLKDAGDIILIRPLKMLIIPLIFTSVIVGITSIGDPARLGLVGVSTVAYYLVTMLIAAIIGAVLVTTIQPGVGVDFGGQDVSLIAEQEYAQSEDLQGKVTGAEGERIGSVWLNILKQLIPTNVVSEAAKGQPLPVIAFAILLGLGLAASGPKGEPAIRFFNSLFEGVMTVVGWVLWMTPIGIFLLVAWTIGDKGIGIGQYVGKYVLTVVLGLLIHGLIVLPTILWFLGKTNPFRFMWQMRQALITAFGTDSSSATLPVTMEVAELEGGCSKKASGFVLPLGSTVNMDGTALYEAVAVVFMFQMFNIDLQFEQLMMVILTATLAAVGAAGIPSAGLVTMVIVVQAVNGVLPEDQHLPLTAIGLLWSIDRIVDMCRTTVNVWGDAVGCKIITRIAPDIEEEMEAALG